MPPDKALGMQTMQINSTQPHNLEDLQIAMGNNFLLDKASDWLSLSYNKNPQDMSEE